MRRDELVDQHNRNSDAEVFGKSRHGFAVSAQVVATFSNNHVATLNYDPSPSLHR